MTASPGGEGREATFDLSSVRICSAIAFPSIFTDGMLLVVSVDEEDEALLRDVKNMLLDVAAAKGSVGDEWYAKLVTKTGIENNPNKSACRQFNVVMVKPFSLVKYQVMVLNMLIG